MFCSFLTVMLGYLVFVLYRLLPPFREGFRSLIKLCFSRLRAAKTPAKTPFAPQVCNMSVKYEQLKDIERRCGRAVAIDATVTKEAFASYHSQDQSPLFTQLPREIRDHIWTYATAPYEEENHQYARNAYYYRPGHTARLRTDTDLLLTCRRAWLEANALPMLQAEHCFWYHREAPDCRNKEWMAKLTAANRRNFGHLHLFAQMYAIEGLRAQKGRLRNYFLASNPVANDFQPRMLHVTIRHTDWWYWESETPLRFSDVWFQAMLDSEDLRSTHTLKLELETLNYKVEQLLPIVERLQRLESREIESHIVDGKAVRTKFVLHGRPEVQEWSGPIDINGANFDQYKGKDKLDYHVITLTWRLKFPQLPRAFVPKLRLAPRIGAPVSQTLSPHDRDNDLPPAPRNLSNAWRSFNGLTRYMPDQNDGAADGTFQSNYEMTELQGTQHTINIFSAYQAAVHQAMERKRFSASIADVNADMWKAKWAAEGSLLRFAELS